MPRSAFVALMLALSISLAGIAFLLGRESKSSEAPIHVTKVEASTDQQQARSQEDRESQVMSVAKPPRPVVLQVEAPPVEPKPKPKRSPLARVEKAPVRASARPVPKPPIRQKKAPVATQKAKRTVAAPDQSTQASAAIRTYFSKIDSTLAGTQSLGDPNAFATELLQGSLSGDTSKLDSLTASSKQAVSKVQKIQAPPSCVEHHSLLLKQLRQGTQILIQVGGATNSLDTSSLSQLSESGAVMQAEAQRLQELERKLRGRM